MTSGDDNFKEFLNKGDDDDNNVTEMIIVINAIKAKVTAVSELYKETLSVYKDIPKEDPLKAELKKFLSELIVEAKQSFTQFDYALLQDDENGENDEP